MKKWMFIMSFGIAVCGFFSAPALALTTEQLAQLSPGQKMQAQKYFQEHSLGFSAIFKRYHPGPYWILKNKQTFHLTTKQIQQETRLKEDMAKNTIADERVLQRAYKNYALYAATAEPAPSILKKDITAVGKAQTRLAWEMVPYHLQGYALLNPAQKKIYTRLAAQTWAHQQNKS
ncbi:MAG: hypothetical protein ACYCZC_01290 [Acidithiobacillus sp.]